MFSWTAPQRTPLVIAHRGASRRAPENTLAAFSRAIDDGADGIELDVRLTADGRVVVFHDSRLERTTDGTGRIENMSSEQLSALSSGAWFHPVFHRERIPTLDDVFELINRRVGVNIELKSDRLRRPSFAIVNEVLNTVKRHRSEKLVLLSSFQHALLRYAQIIRSDIAIGFLFHTVTAFGRLPLRRTRRASGAFLIVNGTTCTKRLVRRAHESNVLVGEYTVNSSRRIRRALRFGVDAVYTDDPAAVIKELAAAK